MSKDLVIGIIGGTGLTRMDNLAVTEELTVSTPFGPPSDAILKAKIWGREVFFLPRHGRGHRIPPHRINYRANVFALKSLGVEIILSVSAVGSMRESIVPGQLVFPDQFLDRTKQRPGTFFDEGLVAHVPFADPLCPHLRAKLTKAAERLSIPHHTGGTYVCIEGPQFSTRAESLFYRSLGVEVIGMTNATEARLAREAECCYATIPPRPRSRSRPLCASSPRTWKRRSRSSARWSRTSVPTIAPAAAPWPTPSPQNATPSTPRSPGGLLRWWASICEQTLPSPCRGYSSR